MTIKAIANQLNKLSQDYDFGNLPDIRKKLKGFKSLNKNNFTHQTIKKQYAFHNGGRRETQFNFGFEKHRKIFRFGIAFSLQKNRTLLNPIISFRPRIEKYNEYIKKNKKYFKDFVMWAYQNENLIVNTKRIDIIPDNLIQEKSFIFIGKYIKIKDVKNNPIFFSEILETYDRLLPLYEYIEAHFKSVIEQRTFVFKAGMHPGKTSIIKHIKASQKTIQLMHKQMVEQTYNKFVASYGYQNVSTENETPFGTTIDMVLKTKKGYIFYEFKTSGSLREIIREALSQLMEYSYYPLNNNAKKLIIVSTNPINPECQEYLNHLRKKFTIPVYYQRYDEKKKSLDYKEY